MKKNLTKLLLLTALATSLNAEVQTVKNEFTLSKNEIEDCPEKNLFTTKNNDSFTICNKNDKSYEITFEGTKHNLPFNRPVNCNNKQSEGYKIIEHANHIENIDGYIKNIYSCINEDKIFIEIEDNRFNNK
jgi:hypothetical protein